MIASGLRAFGAFVALVLRRFRAVRGAQVAGSLAFTTLLALVPLVAVGLVLISKFQLFASLGTELRGFLLAYLLPDKAGRMIAGYTGQFSQKAAGLTIVGALALFATALMLVATIDRAFQRIWAEREHRFDPRRVLAYAAVLVFGPVALGASLAATTYLLRASLGLVNEPLWVTALFYRTVPIVFLATLFAFLYFAIPNRRVDWRHAAVGGLFAALALVLMQRLFGLYLAKVPTYTLIYGTFATIPIFLVWLYLSWTVILFGALVTALLPEHLAGVRPTRPHPGRALRAALIVLRTLARAGWHGEGVSVHRLAAAAAIAVIEAEDLLAHMRLLGWVVPFDEDRWLPSRSLHAIRLSEVFDAFALDVGAWPEPHGATDAELKRRIAQAVSANSPRLASPLAVVLD